MSSADVLFNLTPEQKKAVTTVDGPLLIIAGAGSGKTRVITQRIAYLIQNKIPPEQILAITFTNKATAEMKHRVCQYARGEQVWVSTFHAFCARILRRHAMHLGYSPHYLIYDTDDKKTLIQNIVKDKKIQTKALGQISGFISDIKRKMSGSEQNLSLPSPLDEIFPEYQERLRNADAMDFEDLLLNTMVLFETVPDVLNYYQNFFRYISVDEYQDTNDIQAELMFRLSELNQNICVCGDPNQSIYAFRGARIENILKFEERYPKTEVVKLEENFRSTQNILDVAAQVVVNNTQHIDFQAFTQNDRGNLPTAYVCQNEQAESSLIADTIQKFQEEGYNLADMAVFYRINAQSRNIENTLVLRRIPYQIVGGTSFYQRKEIKDLLAYLRFSVNPLDEISLFRVLNLPPRGIGAATIKKLRALAEEEGQNFYWALQHAGRLDLKKRALNAIENFLVLIEHLKESSEQIYETLTFLVEQIDYRNYLSKLQEHSSISREDNVNELLNAALEFERTYPQQCGVSWFLEEIALLSDIDQLKEDEDKVTLMTLHSSKGLEFPVVIFAGLEEGLLPHVRSQDSMDQIEEERRLCYVGITRAQKELVLTRCISRMNQGLQRYNEASRFLSEIDPDYLKTKNLAYTPSYTDWEGSEENKSHDNYDSYNSYETKEGGSGLDMVFHTGELVRHPNLGYGKIVRMSGPKKRRRATIKFIDGSERQVDLQFSNLEKADWSDIGEVP